MEKAKLITEGKKEITVQFNPAEYQIANSVRYAEKPIVGFDGAVSQFISGSNAVLNLTLYFDTYIPPRAGGTDEGGTNVALKTREITALAQIDGSLHRPPQVTFSWGAVNFKGIITEVKESYTMFLSDGMPVRAKVELTMKEVFDSGSSKRQQPFESPDRTKFRRVRQGEYLWNYAFEEYKDPDAWSEIAAANGLKHPLDIRPGQLLRIPAVTKQREDET
ncbi:MAG: LysM peptidoglycan-binding domain-containing protein [Lachnospiraceae bacterium]|nr:LysM peptidoglycan-binding domain-containing protein [Lachnospiraceae bacterium]